MLILFIILMVLLVGIFAIAAVAVVLGLFALVFVLIQAVAAFIGLAIATPYIIDWVLDTYWKMYRWVCDHVLMKIAYPAGVLTGKFFVLIGKKDWLLQKVGRLESADQEHDEQNHRNGNQDPNQVLHNPNSLR